MSLIQCLLLKTLIAQIFWNEMSNPLEKYQKLGLKEALSRIYRYPKACKELSFILRGAYNKLPKNVQALIFQDTLTAFRLLPQYVKTSFTQFFLYISRLLIGSCISGLSISFTHIVILMGSCQNVNLWSCKVFFICFFFHERYNYQMSLKWKVEKVIAERSLWIKFTCNHYLWFCLL